MSKLKRGQIVLVRFPFVDEGKTKLRPALVLEDTLDDDVLVLQNYRAVSQIPFRHQHQRMEEIRLAYAIDHKGSQNCNNR